MFFRERPRIAEPEIHFPEKEVRFSFSKCDTNKWCVTLLERKELEHFYQRMGCFESCNWRTVQGMAREQGISIDKKKDEVYRLLATDHPSFSTFGHFRVKGTNANIRIFVGIDRDLAYILRIDRTGKMQH